jgi:hypothetical protein
LLSFPKKREEKLLAVSHERVGLYGFEALVSLLGLLKGKTSISATSGEIKLLSEE